MSRYQLSLILPNEITDELSRQQGHLVRTEYEFRFRCFNSQGRHNGRVKLSDYWNPTKGMCYCQVY